MIILILRDKLDIWHANIYAFISRNHNSGARKQRYWKNKTYLISVNFSFYNKLKKNWKLLNFSEDNNWFLHSARVVYYEDNGFWKKILLPQVKTEKKKIDGDLLFLSLVLMEKHAIVTEKNISKSFLNE